MNTRSATMKTAQLVLKEFLNMELFQMQFPIDYISDWLMIRIKHTYVEGGNLIDLGGGFSVTNAVLAKLGMHVYCIDLMDDYFVHSSLKSQMTEQFEFLKMHKVNFIKHNLLEYDFSPDFLPESIDVVSSYHVLEHLHHSPRKMLQQVRQVLKDDGVLFIEVPNAVNLLKKIRVLLGHTNYLPYDGYFNSEKYFGHIREYTIGDLIYLAEKIGFKKYEIFGSNYYGSLYSKIGYGFTARLIEWCLRVRPGLCGSLYLKAIR